MKKYKLLVHKSLGEGIVLLNEGDGIGKVYLKGLGIKSMMLDHPMIEDYDFTIKQFIHSSLYEALFDDYTKKKAESYLSSEHIFIKEYSNNLITGSVFGTETYEFVLEINNSYLNLSCSCPVSGLCKHLYAVMKYLDENDVVATIDSKSIPSKNVTTTSKPSGDKKEISEVVKKNYLFKTNIESFLYDKGNFSFIDFYTILDKLTNEESVIEFIETCMVYYHRDQYRNRISRELLPPFFFSKIFSEIFTKYYEDNGESNDEINALFVTSFGQYNNVILPNIDKQAMLYRANKLIKASIECDLIPFLELKNNSYSFYNASDYIFSLAYLLKRRNLNQDEIKELTSSDFFRRYASQVYNYYLAFSNNKIEGNNILLFLSYVRNIDDIDIPLEYVISCLDSADTNNLFLKTLIKKFDTIDKKDYPLIADYLIYCSDDIGLRSLSKDLIYELVYKLPDAYYVVEVIEGNMSRHHNAWGRY